MQLYLSAHIHAFADIIIKWPNRQDMLGVGAFVIFIYLFIFLCFDFLPFLVCSSSSMQLQHHNLLFLDISIKVRDRCFDILNVILNIYLALLLCIPKVKRVDSRNLSKLRER